MLRLETVRAKIGATILDVFSPGWARKISIRRLKLDRCDSCVLGQLFGDFNMGAEKLFAMRAQGNSRVAEEAATESGFLVSGDLNFNARETAYAFLTSAWKREIARRV